MESTAAYGTLVALSAIPIAALGGGLFLMMHRRLPRTAQLVALATLVLVIASVIPLPGPPGGATLDGVLSGSGTVRVALEANAPFSADAGIERTSEDVHWDCAARTCSFHAGGRSGGARFADATSPRANVTSGTATFYVGAVECGTVPLLVGVLFPQIRCSASACRAAWTPDASGALRADGGSLCS